MAVTKLRKDAAGLLNISDRQLGTWSKLPGFPKVSSGWDVDAIKAWRSANDRKGSETEQRNANTTFLIKVAKLEEIKKKNTLLQIEIDEKNRKLLPVAVVHELLMDVAGVIRGLGRTLQQNGNDAAAKLIDLEMEKVRRIVSAKLGRPAGDAPK